MQTGQSYLEERKILPATIQAHRLEVDVAPTAERIVQRLGEDILLAGQPLSQYSAELLWFPYLNADGAITSWTARIFPTPVNGPKFLTPKGGNGAPYITPAVWAIADKAHLPLIITEGPCKALSCIQAGFPAVGLNGVYGATARDADDKIVLHPLLSSINWVKRTVLLGFDADLTSKFDVRKALFRTYLVLAAQQADVFTITSWDVDQAKGIDDFLATGDKPEEQLELLIKDRAPFLSILEKSGADLRLVEEELTAVPLPRLHRAQIIRQLAKEVGVPAKDLLTAISPPETEGGNHRQLNLVDETVPWDAPVGGMDLFKDIYKLLGQVMWMTDSARMTITFWVIAAFAFTVFRKFPYLRIKSADRNCGKSTLIDLLAELVFKPLIAADVTPAGLYRAAEEFQPTILLDEFDNAEQIKELTQLLNAGYDANRVAVRYNTDKGALERFRTFCPKIIASIRRLAETTESRCLPIDMQRVPSDAEKKLKELCDIEPANLLAVKRKILAWIEDNMRAWLESLDADDRLYPPLNPLGAETGRFSCKAPNLLATPRNSEIRGCIIADDGFVLIDPDLANIEMRIAAWFAQEQQMLNIFRNGGDIHGETAARILGDRQARQSAKPVNFGSLYGGGAERLRITARTYGIEFSPEQAKQYHQQFFATYGNLRRWHESPKDASSELSYGATVYGRRRWADPEDSADAWDWNRFQLATNFEVQGVGCDALKIALVQLHQQFANSPTRILLPIHDAILVQTPEGAAEGVAETIGHAMREAFAAIFGPNFPVAVETNISKRWGDGK